MAVIYRPKIKQVIGNGTANHKIMFTPGKRIHGVQLECVFPSGTSYDTLAECVNNILSVRVLAGTFPLWSNITPSAAPSSGTTSGGKKLRDFLLLFGTRYDWNINTSTNTVQLTISFAPEWFIESVQDLLALNPARLGGPLSLEIDFTAGIAVSTTAWEFASDDLDADSAGYLSLETVTTKAAGTSFTVSQPEIKAEGALLALSIYPDSGAGIEVGVSGGVSFQVGANNRFVHEEVTSAQNDEEIERKGLTPTASGRSSYIYDFVPVKGDSLTRAIDLAAAKQSVLTINSGSAMSGTTDLVIARLMPNRTPNAK